MMALFSVLLLVASVQVAICKPYDLVVTDVGSNSAIIHWKTNELSTKIKQFQILCNGTRHYVSIDGEHLLDTDEKLQYAPSGMKNTRIGDLQENFNYSCTVQEDISSQTQILHGVRSDPCKFSTNYGDPEQPKTPEVQISRRRRSVKIKLFPTSTRFGPISGYQVQFHLVKSKIDGLALVDDDAFHPRSPSSRLVSKSEAQLSIEAKSFWLDFDNGTLPINIAIGQKLLQGALKNGREYTVATVPYTVYTKENESVLLFTPSNLSAIFKTWNVSSTTALLDKNDPAELALVIALGVGLPLLLLGYLTCFAAALYCILRRRRMKRMRKEYSRRDVIHALALRKAQQMGIELPWYNHRMTDENQGDLPWLDPFSAAEAQPRIVPTISSTSHNDLNQLEAGIGTRTQPPDSPVMPNDAVLRDAPPVYSEGRDLTGRQGDIDSTMAAQKSDAAQLVAAVLTRAVLVVSRLTAPELAGQGVLTVVISSNCDKSPPGEASIVVNESTKPYNSEEDNTVQSAENERLSVASGDEPNDCDNHSTGRAEMENGRDLGENSTSPERASLVVEESLYSPKSEEEGSSDIICQLAQNLASALQCTKSSDCDDQSKEGIGAEEGKQLPGDAVPEQLSASIDSSVRSDTDLVELALPLKEAVNDPDLNENRLSHEEASLEMEESFYSSKSSNDEEQSPSVIQVNSSVQSTDCKQPSVASADQSASGHNNDESGTGSSIQSIDKHFSLYQVVSSAGCVSSDYCDSSSKFQTGNISPEDGSSKQTNEEESSQSTNHKNLSPQPVTVASTASLMSDESGRLDGPLHTTCDVDHDIIAASLDFKQMVYDSRSSSCRLRHIYTDYNQAEYKPLIKDCSLEVNVSSHSLKTSKSDSSCIAGRSKLRDNSISRRANTPSICSEPRLNTTDNPSSSDFCLYIARSSAYERLRAESTAHNKSNIDHANYGRDVVDRPLSIGHDGHFTGDIDILQSPHKLSADQGSSLSLKSTNGTAAACSNEHVCVIMDDADYFTALSSQCSSEQAAGSEDIHTTPSRPMMPPAPDIGFIMNPRAHSSPNPSGCDDYQSAAKNMDHTSHYNDRNTSVDKSLPGDVYFESCVDKMSPLPRNASPELNCDSDDGNFQDSSSTIGSGHQSLHQVASSNYPFFSVKAASYGISADYSPSDSRSYPLDSNDETRVIMDLDEVELPHSRYYDDQELLDADINTRLPITACSSTDYYSAASGTSGHDSGNHPSPVNSVLSTEDEVRIIMELEGSPNGDSSMLKMSSSTSLFIPRGLSNAQWKSSSSLASHSDQRNDSTTTFHSILLQLSGSSAGEEDKEQRSNDPQLPQLVYEPY